MEGDCDDDDNMITEIEKMMCKENIGINERMKVPSVESVRNAVKKEGNGNSNDKKEKNEKISIFEKNEIEKTIDNAKKAAKELEMLIDKRIEMKKNKKRNVERKQDVAADCSVITEAKNDNNDNNDGNKNENSDNGKRGGFGLRYTINRDCLVMNGRKLNIPKMRQSNPFENLIRRQRVSDNNGNVVRFGSRNYDKKKIGEHESDSESESSSVIESGDDDDDIGLMNGSGGGQQL